MAGATDRTDGGDEQTQRADELVPGRAAAPPAAVGDTEDAVAPEVNGALTDWDPTEPNRQAPSDAPDAADQRSSRMNSSRTMRQHSHEASSSLGRSTIWTMPRR